MTARDKRILLIGGAVIIAIIILFAWVLPTLEEIHRLDRAIVKERKTLNEVRKFHRIFLQMGEREALVQEKLRKRAQESFSIASVIEEIARESQLMEQVQYIKPDQGEVTGEYREASVSLKATQIDLDVLVDFIHRVESSDRILRIQSLQIRAVPKVPGKVDLTLTVSTLLPAEQTT
jgi:type II secretory pathway component PulM